MDNNCPLALVMDIRIVRLYRQYLQQLDELSYPLATVLLEPPIQNEISCGFFDSSNIQHLPPLGYQKRVLKNITDRILSAIQDPNEDVCFSWPCFFVLVHQTSFPICLSFSFRLTFVSSGCLRQVDGAYGHQVNHETHVCIRRRSAEIDRFVLFAI